MSDNIIRGISDPSCDPDARGIGAMFIDKLKEYRNKIAQIDGVTGETETYGDLLLKSIRVAQIMQEKGITSNDIITLCTYNSLDSCLPMLAALFLGVRVASLDPTLSCADAEHLFKLVEPRLVFCEAESVSLVKSALKNSELSSQCEIVVFGDTEDHIPFSDFLVSTGTEDAFEVMPVKDINETAIIFFSSGTTGLPKGICATHYGLISQQKYILQGHDTRVLLYFTTFYWISAVMLFFMSIMQGTIRIVCKKFEEELAMKIIDKYKVTYCFMAPIYTYKITKLPNLSQYDTSSLKTIVIGGGFVGEKQLITCKNCLPHTQIYLTYGMTEASGCVTIFHPINDKDILESKMNSCGRAVAGLSYKIVDTETEEVVGANRRGEIRLKGKCLMNGYHNNPVESTDAWDSEGYLHTGDIGYYDEDKCFYVVDRIKDMMKYQSWHVVPAELESILLTHPYVKEAAVIGIPHHMDGEHPMGVVVLKPGVKISENEILDFFNENVPDRKKLRGGITFVANLPHTPSGKLRRRDIRISLIKGN